jgi:outer membrane protein assembly factor BamB
MKYLFLLVVVPMLFACPKPAPIDPTQPKLVWKTKLHNDVTGCIYPVVATNSVLYSNWKTSGTPTEPIISLNKNTGAKEWEWSDYQISNNNTVADVSGLAIYSQNDKVIFATGSRNYAIDVKTGKTLWQTQGDVAAPYVRGVGDVCLQVKAKQIAGEDQPYVSKCNINTGQWQTVFTDTIVKDFKPNAVLPLPYVDTNGDTLIICIKNLYRFPPNEALRSLIYCFNMTKNRMVYTKEIFSNEGASTLPVIHKNKIYATSNNKIVCVDIATGDKTWVSNPITTSNSTFTNFTVAEGKVLAGNENSKLYCYDAATGQLIWEKEKTIANTNSINKPTVLNGILYYNALSKLYAVDIQTGEFLWQYKLDTGNSNLFFNQSLTVDPIGKRIYAHDFQNAYCFEAIR